MSLILKITGKNRFVPKLCIYCKHFIPNRLGDTFGQCQNFPKKDYDVEFLVHGTGEQNQYYYCSTARGCDNMCGKEGKYHTKK